MQDAFPRERGIQACVSRLYAAVEVSYIEYISLSANNARTEEFSLASRRSTRSPVFICKLSVFLSLPLFSLHTRRTTGAQKFRDLASDPRVAAHGPPRMPSLSRDEKLFSGPLALSAATTRRRPVVGRGNPRADKDNGRPAPDTYR